MPIKGLTDQPPAFTEIGRLRKGEKKTDPRKPGRDLTYFRPDFNEGEERAAQMFFEAYGPEPREVNIVLPFDNVDDNLDAWKEAYLAGGLIHRCNGEHVQYAIDPDTGETLVSNGRDANGERVLCDGQPVAYWTDRNGKEQPVYCEPAGRLKAIVVELRRLAYVTVMTTSIWDCANLSRQLEAIKVMNNGSLRGVPLVLKRRPYMKSTPGPNGKRVRRKIWLLSVEADPEWVGAKLEAMRVATLPNGDAMIALPPGVPDTNGDDEIMEAEIEELPFAEEPEEAVYEEQEEQWIQPPEDGPSDMAKLYEMAPTALGINRKDAEAIIQQYLNEKHGGGNIGKYVQMVGQGQAASTFWKVLQGSI